MAVTVYKSTDASSPVVTGLAGSLIALLDGCLVNGYTGKTTAGWAKTYTGTNKAVYRAAAGARQYFRVDDTASGAVALGKEAFLKGYEAMTDIDTGTALFPTATQLASGLFLRKSMDANSVARPWIVVADSKTAYVFIMTGDYTGYAAFMFGEFYSVAPSDLYRSIIIGRHVQEAAATPQANSLHENLEFLCLGASNINGHYTPRSSSGTAVSAAPVGKHGNMGPLPSIITTNMYPLAGLVSYPNPTDSGLYLSQVWVHEAGGTTVIRGRMRGFWHLMHPVGAKINDGDTWNGTGALAGKSFVAIKSTASGLGTYVMETSDTWETN